MLLSAATTDEAPVSVGPSVRCTEKCGVPLSSSHMLSTCPCWEQCGEEGAGGGLGFPEGEVRGGGVVFVLPALWAFGTPSLPFAFVVVL